MKFTKSITRLGRRRIRVAEEEEAERQNISGSNKTIMSKETKPNQFDEFKKLTRLTVRALVWGIKWKRWCWKLFGAPLCLYLCSQNGWWEREREEKFVSKRENTLTLRYQFFKLPVFQEPFHFNSFQWSFVFGCSRLAKWNYFLFFLYS